MPRMIHYKTKRRKFSTTDDITLEVAAEDHNALIGGEGPIGESAIQLIKRKMAKKHLCTEEQIIICNIFDV